MYTNAESYWANAIDRIDDEQGEMDCNCGEVYQYTGWNSPETIAWATQHDGEGHGYGVTMTKDCSCGLLDHPLKKCAPLDEWP